MACINIVINVISSLPSNTPPISFISSLQFSSSAGGKYYIRNLNGLRHHHYSYFSSKISCQRQVLIIKSVIKTKQTFRITVRFMWFYANLMF